MIQLWARICRRYRNISDPFSHAFLKKDPFCHAFLKKIIYFQCVISCQSVSLSHCDGASQVEHDIIILRVPPNANESRSTYSLLWTSFFFKSLIKNPKQMQRLHEEVLLSVTATALRAPLVPRSMKPRNIMYWAQFLLIPFACWFSFSISFWIPFPQVSAHLRWNSKLLRDKKNANRHLGILIILLVFQLPKGRLSYPVLSFLLCHGF